MGAVMLRVRRLVAAALVAGACVCALGTARGGASALPSCTPVLPQSITGAHFTVFYEDDPSVAGHITQVQAGTVLAAAERSYASYVGAGFPVPAVGLSGTTELYVMDLSQFKLSAVFCTGSVVEDAATVTGDSMPFSVGTDVFTQIEQQLGTNEPTWLVDGTSDWASWRALGYPAESVKDIGPFDVALDCASAYDKQNCSALGSENLGGTRWPFYEYLAEKFGPLFIGDIITAAEAVGGDGRLGLENALAAKGTTLGVEYGSYAAKLLTGGWTATPLNAATIPVSGSKIQTGISSGSIPAQSFGVNHLSTKFVEIDRGDGAGDHACYGAQLTLTVQIPSGVTTHPTFYWTGGGSSPVALSISGSTATTTVPWDTCAWKSKGYLALPNTSLVDGTSFVVSGSLSVDFSSPASAAVPPAPANQFGDTIDASSFSTAPTISLFGPQIMLLSSTDTALRLIVESSGDGSVTAAFGSLLLGSRTLRAGGNDLRFKLPQSALQALRRTSGTLLLTLTPLAPDGKASGAALTRSVSVENVQPAKKKTAKKHPAKKHAAKKKHQ